MEENTNNKDPSCAGRNELTHSHTHNTVNATVERERNSSLIISQTWAAIYGDKIHEFLELGENRSDKTLNG